MASTYNLSILPLYYSLSGYDQNSYILNVTYVDVRYQNSNKTLNYSNKVYGVAYIKTLPANSEFTINGLTPGHDYEIFIFIMNMNQLYNVNFTKLYFHTNGNISYKLKE